MLILEKHRSKIFIYRCHSTSNL